eukprot:TRINITY_DN33088_c0_g1_i1.p1 TRINITY_DN33088_c0_g1~~TRINITY_DN33088_c0_g1_i1.p1  ORF type:complete len:371 (+),score=25.81 TRINITY_DN33088_c0_g1_i1:35-1114(+)
MCIRDRFFALHYYLMFFVARHDFDMKKQIRWNFLLPSHAVLFLFLWCYLRTIASDAGKVPDLLDYSFEDQERGVVRYCNECENFKPERCHHCSICKRCSLNMEHHCKWIDNCVGFKNRKFFMLTLFYGLFSCGLADVIETPYVLDLWIYRREDHMKLGLMTFNIAVILILTFTLFSFFANHLHMVIINRTTIEKQFAKDSPNLYDVGRFKNWLQVFGKNFFFWILPLHVCNGKPQGDGMNWPKGAGSDDSDHEVDQFANVTSELGGTNFVQAENFRGLDNYDDNYDQQRKALGGYGSSINLDGKIGREDNYNDPYMKDDYNNFSMSQHYDGTPMSYPRNTYENDHTGKRPFQYAQALMT